SRALRERSGAALASETSSTLYRARVSRRGCKQSYDPASCSSNSSTPVHRGGTFTVESQSLSRTAGTVNPLPVCCRSICVGLKYRWRRGKGITGTPLAPLSVSVDFVLVALRNSLLDTNDYTDPHTFSQSHPLSIYFHLYLFINLWVSHKHKSCLIK
ncbi:hypothetical protein G9C98_007222, partial [Cotesia typhae]